MKEATGELNLTVVVVIIVAGLAFFFFSVLWPQIKGNYASNTKCDEAICPCPKDSNGKCKAPTNGLVECYLAGHEDDKFICAWKG